MSDEHQPPTAGFSVANEHREFLGDGVYVDFDGYHLVLQVENGISVTAEIFIEPEVFENFCSYVERLHKKLGGEGDNVL